MAERTLLGQGAGRFLTTQWSLVVAAGGEGADGTRRSREALEDLCGRYWYPVYAFARRRGANAEDAQDLVQGFFSHLIERHTLRSADPERGRFRSFLLGAFKRYLTDEHRRATAAKRGGDTTLLELDADAAEERYRIEADAEESPERLYARRWALELLAQTRRRLDAELANARDPERSRRLARLLTDSDGAPYRRVAEELGMSEAAVKVAVHRLRRRYGALLREEVARTVDDPARVDEELKQLFEYL